MIPNDFNQLIGINDLDNNKNKTVRFLKYLTESKSIIESLGCNEFDELKSKINSEDIHQISATESEMDNKIIINVYYNPYDPYDGCSISTSDFDLIRSALDSSESELNFDLDDFDIDTMESESSVESILQGIAEVFDPDCIDLTDLEFEEGKYRYISENAIFIPLNPDKFRSVGRIKALKEYIEKQSDVKSTLRLVYNDTINTIGIICIY